MALTKFQVATLLLFSNALLYQSVAFRPGVFVFASFSVFASCRVVCSLFVFSPASWSPFACLFFALSVRFGQWHALLSGLLAR
ncbi:hypothetical protein QYF36_020707 [Acer negundo]|nr:hypothetical protein QYF36_020707 [Acer negundo]